MKSADGDGAGQGARSPGRTARARLDAHARRRIGQGLRLHDASLLAQPLPERFEALLADRAGGAGPEEPSR